MMGKNYIDDDIVISGISGRFPESDNIDELKENLYNHVDMVTEDDRRWPVGKLYLKKMELNESYH